MRDGVCELSTYVARIEPKTSFHSWNASRRNYLVFACPAVRSDVGYRAELSQRQVIWPEFLDAFHSLVPYPFGFLAVFIWHGPEFTALKDEASISFPQYYEEKFALHDIFEVRFFPVLLADFPIVKCGKGYALFRHPVFLESDRPDNNACFLEFGYLTRPDS